MSHMYATTIGHDNQGIEKFIIDSPFTSFTGALLRMVQEKESKGKEIDNSSRHEHVYSGPPLPSSGTAYCGAQSILHNNFGASHLEEIAAAGSVGSLEELESAYARDENYFQKHKATLLQKYRGKYIAIRGETIVGVANDLVMLDRIIDERVGANARAFVAKVTEDAFQQRDAVTIFMD